MTLYLGNNEVSQKVLLNQTVGSNLPAITPETSGKILSNNGSTLEWVDKPSGKIVGSFGYTIDEVAPDGCVFCDGGEYEKAKFPDFYQSLVDNKRKSVDYATFDSSVSTNGSCGFFGLDTENEKFKVPMLKDVYLKAGQEPIIFGGESLPNIYGDASVGGLTGTSYSSVCDNTNGCFTVINTSTTVSYSTTTAQNKPSGVRFNASRNSSTYQNGAKVNPDYVAYKVFVVIYNAETEISESQTSEFLNTVNDINNKIDSSRTNCITKIPQDIKLEVTDGAITLKAGSKVYVPNGVGIFDEVTIQEDKVALSSGANGKVYLFVRDNGVDVYCNQAVSEAVSGTTPPTFKGLFYNTSENKIYFYDNGTVADESFSLPLAVVTASADRVLSIDQVFNGFGYIGSTIFVLPGVEGIIPNGRNTDGSLNNIKFKTTEVQTWNAYTGDSLLRNFIISWNQSLSKFDLGVFGSINDNMVSRYYVQKEEPVLSDTQLWYNPETAIWKGRRFDDWEICFPLIIFNSTVEDNHITSFSLKNVFQVVDRNDTEWASTASKPSNRYIALTLEASGSEFKAPSNGYFFCNVTITSDTANNNALTISNHNSLLSVRSIDSNTTSTIGHNLYIPCQAGDVIDITYTGTLVGHNLKFIYDEGSK